MANEYIDKVEVGAKIQTMYIRREMDYGGENDFCRGMRKALRIIENTPSADVQPIDRWISVKDKLPETNAIGIAHILAYDKYDGVVKADFLDESANYRYGSNIFIISNTSAPLHKVTHWQPLPEPPKKGDTNG